MPDMLRDGLGLQTFLQRLRNSWDYVQGHMFDLLFIQPHVRSLYREYGVDLRRPGGAGRDSVVLLNSDFAVEWLQPLPPHVKLVGPVMVEDPKPLPPDLEAFVQGSPQGFVLVSAGTVIQLSMEHVKEIGNALVGLPVRVIWKLRPEEAAMAASLNLPSDVKVMTWMPQNDLLAHPHMRAFVTHCGMNSLYETIWHGVPLVGIPGMMDQPWNCRKADFWGFGVSVASIYTVTTDQLRSAINHVLAEPSFKEQALLAQARLRAAKRPGVMRAIDWVEHVMETNGSQYLRMPGSNMSFIARNSLDVGAVWVGGVLALLALVAVAARQCWASSSKPAEATKIKAT
eukprot:jgi/Botrbrau1/8068/Bobra.13_2s0034.1